MNHIVNGLLGTLAVVCGALTVRILRAFRDREAQAEVSFQLHPEDTIQDFTWLFGGGLVMAAGHAAYIAGAATGNYYGIRAGQFGSIMFATTTAVVLYRWHLRFTGKTEDGTSA